MARKFPNPQDDNDKRVIENVRHHGCHIIHVGVRDDEKGPGWSYSIGLFHSFEQPELIIFGLPWSSAETIINGLATRMKAGQQFSHGQTDSAVLMHNDVRFILVPSAQYREYLGYALWFYGGKEFPTLQLVWPDKAGLFPWDANGTLDDAIQPVLGNPS